MTDIHAFLEQFDAYTEARAQLRTTQDGSDDEQRCINHCASQWTVLVAMRQRIPAEQQKESA